MKKTIAIWISMLSIYAYSEAVPSAAAQLAQPKVVAGVQTNPQNSQASPNKTAANDDPAEDMDDDEIMLDDDNSDNDYDYDDDDDYIDNEDDDDNE